MFHRTLACFKRSRITIPQLSPTHTRARIVQWCLEPPFTGQELESYDPLFVLECTPDLLSPGYRVHENHKPLMIVEAHDEGILEMKDDIKMNEWMDVGDFIGWIDDGDDDNVDESDWLWQAYSHGE